MWRDPIVDEIHRIREEHAAKFDYDLDRIVEDIKKHEDEERAKGRVFVTLEPRRPKPVSTRNND